MSRCFKHITLADRRRIYQLVAAKVSVNDGASASPSSPDHLPRDQQQADHELPDCDAYLTTVAHGCWRLIFPVCT